MRSRTDPPPRPEQPSARPSRPLRVLVAEDNPVNRRLVQALLEHRGHTPILAADGREAVTALERESFDAVLMDVEMPGMDGFAATAAIRAWERVSGVAVRIIALTAHAGDGVRERCLAAGMDGHLAKPIDAGELMALLEGAAGAPARTVETADRLRGELGRRFVADAARLAAEMRAAIAAHDAKTLHRAAHQLRGTAGHFGAGRLRELAERLEALGKAGDTGRRAEEACRELSAEAARLERPAP